MKPVSSDGLFTDLSLQSASQTRGGNWAKYPYDESSAKTIVRFRYYPGSQESSPTTINITNPKFDDGSIVNFGGDNVNVSNPNIDDGASLAF